MRRLGTAVLNTTLHLINVNQVFLCLSSQAPDQYDPVLLTHSRHKRRNPYRYKGV